MNRIYVSRPYIEKRPTASAEILCPTGSDLTISERKIIQELLANEFRTRRLYKGRHVRQQPLVEVLH
jgi:hypothetical protein